ncbi:tyrosine-protein phosphatase non-receptor type 2 [Xiphophorus couchianus]|uniref:tyrosine-protein phosphatase non-receptor type 2 n=1 Tax=Xiphophorus couchianus TaxID=32473 RepID=UPI001016FA29|nr:tyrosine-protein phosphatase non-receptor type 2-like [Xiphophorus couchianus]XP_032437010.1 tyrosine-protein phosphatase non-receptor type 2-like [Xiphophorus hellerii]
MEQTGAATVKMDQEFEDMDSKGRWQKLYSEIRNQSHECSYKVAKYPENRNRNRYRDVSPFDHSRVKLENAENDYINASLVVMEDAQRSYILTQGPLKNTCGHFWLMIWEQKTKAVIMLNRVIEKGSEKCAQYWPTAEEREMAFRDTRFMVTLLSEDTKSYYTTRVLQLQNINTGEKREIHHFHYTTWPDFGVPESPASFLNFLFKVRESGALGLDHGPAVVHCSAGIGRSGTFSLVDTCLVLMDKRKDPLSVDIKNILLKMRKYRMGLIQTPEQLRFSYMAVLEGAKFIMGDSSVQNQWRVLSEEDQEPSSESPPSSEPQARCPPERHNGTQRGGQQEEAEDYRQDSRVPTQSSCKEQELDGSTTHKRRREDNMSKSVNTKTPQGKSRSTDSDRKRKRMKTSDC